MMGPKQRKERALGESLQLKAERSMSPKSALTRRPYKPGQHGNSRRRRNVSDYGLQIMEKQKVKLTYRINEQNLRVIMKEAAKSTGDVSRQVVELLERRLDNVVFRAGFAAGRSVSHKLVLDGHIAVNGVRTKSPGFQVKVGDVVSVYERSKDRAPFRELKAELEKYEAPYWLQVNAAQLSAQVTALPRDVEVPFQIPLVVESFSK
jgi:small subunit ribosomal protein S4